MRHILIIFSFVLTMQLFAGNLTSQGEGSNHAGSFKVSTLSFDCPTFIETRLIFSKSHRIQFNSQVSIVAPIKSHLEDPKSLIPSRRILNEVVSSPIKVLTHDFYSLTTETKRVDLINIKVRSIEREVSKLNHFENRVDINIADRNFPICFQLGTQKVNGIVMIENEDQGFMSKKKTTKVG